MISSMRNEKRLLTTLYRTHRERKEVYIKNLEDQLVQLRETFTGTVHERNSIAEENRRLKELLRAHGIADSPFDGYSVSGGEPSGYAGSVADSRASSYPYTSAFSPAQSTISAGNTSPGMRQMQRPSVDMFGSLPQGSQQQQQQLQSPQQQFQQQQQQQQSQQPQQGGIDHDQLGVDFVLASVNHQQHRGAGGAGGPRYLGPSASQLPHASRPR